MQSFLLILQINAFLYVVSLVNSFRGLQKVFTKAPISVYNKRDVNTIIERNLNKYVDSRVFFELDNDELLYTISIFLNLNLTKYNY